jgi:hypothetical protein
MAMLDRWAYVFRQLSLQVVDWSVWPRVLRERREAMDRYLKNNTLAPSGDNTEQGGRE